MNHNLHSLCVRFESHTMEVTPWKSYDGSHTSADFLPRKISYDFHGEEITARDHWEEITARDHWEEITARDH